MYEVFVVTLRSWIPGLRFWMIDIPSQVLCPGSWLFGPRYLVPVHLVIIAKCEKKLLLIVAAITKCNKTLL